MSFKPSEQCWCHHQYPNRQIPPLLSHRKRLTLSWTALAQCPALTERGMGSECVRVRGRTRNHRRVTWSNLVYFTLTSFILSEGWRMCASHLPQRRFYRPDYGNSTRNRHSKWTNGISNLKKNCNNTPERLILFLVCSSRFWLRQCLKCL